MEKYEQIVCRCCGQTTIGRRWLVTLSEEDLQHWNEISREHVRLNNRGMIIFVFWIMIILPVLSVLTVVAIHCVYGERGELALLAALLSWVALTLIPPLRDLTQREARHDALSDERKSILQRYGIHPRWTYRIVNQ